MKTPAVPLSHAWLHETRLGQESPSVAYNERDDDHHHLTWQLIQESRRVPAGWKGEAINRVAMFVRLARIPSAHTIGDEQDEEKGSDQPTADQPVTQAA